MGHHYDNQEPSLERFLFLRLFSHYFVASVSPRDGARLPHHDNQETFLERFFLRLFFARILSHA